METELCCSNGRKSRDRKGYAAGRDFSGNSCDTGFVGASPHSQPNRICSYSGPLLLSRSFFLENGCCHQITPRVKGLVVQYETEGKQSVQIDVLQATILGTIQGITEFLPISSHAHLILIPWLLGWPDPGLTFDVALHLGTLAALLIYFFQDWVYLTMSAFRIFKRDPDDGDARLALYIILATIPGGIAGLLFEHLEDQISTPTVIASMLIAIALLMRFAEVSGIRKTNLETMRLSDALTIGFAQASAIIPGVSRSGVTITAGLLRGMTRKSAAQFSFLLSAPIVAGAVVKKVMDIAVTG